MSYNPLEATSIALGRIATDARDVGQPRTARLLERLSSRLTSEAGDADEQVSDGLNADDAMHSGLLVACERVTRDVDGSTPRRPRQHGSSTVALALLLGAILGHFLT